MISATILTSSAFNVLVTLAGTLIGMVAFTVAIRARVIDHRTWALEHDLQEALGRLERQPQERAAIEEAISRQEIAVQRVREYARRRQFFYRFLLGYLALFALAAIFVWLLFEDSNGIANLSSQWFVIGIAIATAVGMSVYTLTIREVMHGQHLRSLALSVEPFKMSADLEVERRSKSVLSSRVREWLEAQGFFVEAASAHSGFDLIAMRSGESLVVEVKAGSFLTVEDVDAVAGAVARLNAGAKLRDASRAIVVVPAEALRVSSAGVAAAEELGIAIYSIDNEGNISPAGGGQQRLLHAG